MRIKSFSFIIVLVLVLIVALPASAGGWEEKITGGGQAEAGGAYFSITVSAWSNGDGTFGGNIEYSRTGVTVFHAKVDCVAIHADGTATVAGYGWNQDGTGYLEYPYWVAVGIKEGGDGAGDLVRVWPTTEGTCPHAGSFPGTIYDGNFNIRAR